MKRLQAFSRAAAALIVGLLLSSTAVFAQTATTGTTLSAAITSITANTITVASNTGFTAGSTMAYVDRELMAVTAVNSTTISVIRGSGGTAASTHLTSAVVYVSIPQTFVSVDPLGSCTASNYQYLPIFNFTTGTAWYCNPTTVGATGTVATAYWGGAGLGLTYEARAPWTAIVGGTTYTVKLTDVIVEMYTTRTGAGATGVPAAVTTIALPAVTQAMAGKRLYIKDGSGGITATTYIGFSGTVDGVFNGVGATLKTAYGAYGLEAGSGGWYIISCWKAACWAP